MKLMTSTILALGLASFVATGCEENKAPGTAPSAVKAAADADKAKSKAEAEKIAADKKAADAKAEAKVADKKLDDAKDKAEEAGADNLGPDESMWSKSWGTFHAGKDATVDAGDWSIERGKDGSYTAWRKIKAATAAAATKVEDAAVSAAVKAKLAVDDDVKASTIDVDTKQSVVHLKGKVEKPEQAGEAMRIALGTGGVEKVVSHLTWAGSPAVQ